MMSKILNGSANSQIKQSHFFRYSFSSIGAFILDIIILLFLTEALSFYYLISASVAFSIAVSVQYFALRKWVFKKKERHLGEGYVYFMIISFSGLILTVGFLAFFVEVFSFHYLTARILISIVVGIIQYFLNKYLNFKYKFKS